MAGSQDMQRTMGMSESFPLSPPDFPEPDSPNTGAVDASDLVQMFRATPDFTSPIETKLRNFRTLPAPKNARRVKSS